MGRKISAIMMPFLLVLSVFVDVSFASSPSTPAIDTPFAFKNPPIGRVKKNSGDKWVSSGMSDAPVSIDFTPVVKGLLQEGFPEEYVKNFGRQVKESFPFKAGTAKWNAPAERAIVAVFKDLVAQKYDPELVAQHGLSVKRNKDAKKA